MFLLNYQPTTSGMRFKQRLYKPLNLDRRVVFFVKKKGTKSNLYHKTSTSKFAHIGLPALNIRIVK